MWSRSVCLSRVVLLHWQRCGFGGEVRARWSQLAPIHVSCISNNHQPPRLGDRGPERNYKRKVQKRARKDMDVLLEGMKKLEAQPGAISRGKDVATAMEELLSDVKIHVPSSAEVRKRLGMPEKWEKERPQMKGRDVKTTVKFMDPRAGERLGIFHLPKPGQSVMPTHKPTFAEEDEAKFVRSYLELRVKNRFEVAMEDTKFPRNFPIDNEEYQNLVCMMFDDFYQLIHNLSPLESLGMREEPDSVGFEDHVLLDHLLQGFPTKGPVRHFMELVVSGLSRNPDYTAQEKREYVEWYRKYFSQFTPEELQSITVVKKLPTSE